MSLIALFPGQGSQHVGMTKALYTDFAVAREVFEEASESIKHDLKKICFDGPESDLTLTENTQPCLLTASVAAFRVAQKELGFSPKVVAGHSLGEYSALVAAGSLRLSYAVQWVRRRGQSMQTAVPVGEGTMAAIMGLEDSQVGALCEKATAAAQEARRKGEHSDLSVAATVEPANFNAPGQVVIAGSRDGVQAALTLIATEEFKGGKAIPLSVSAPFHCSLMKKARDEMAGVFATVNNGSSPLDLMCPYVPNRTARLTYEKGVILQLLEEQIDHPVLWKQSMGVLMNEGFKNAVEFGPGKVLQGLAKRIARAEKKELEVFSFGDTSQLKALEEYVDQVLGQTATTH